MSFQQGLSGLAASAKNLDVIGNNVANSNTYGEKSARAQFADVYAGAMNSGGGSNQVGAGVAVDGVDQQFTQGNITSTSNALDLAINGSGFFQLSTDVATAGTTKAAAGSTAVGSITYSRNGEFKVDKDGYIVNAQSQKLIGYPADALGNVITGQNTVLKLPTAGINPVATTKMSMEVNLDSRVKATGDDTTTTIDLTDPKTYNNATSVTAYDAKGQDVAVTYYFQKTATDTWNVYATANGTALNPDADGKPGIVTTMVFPTNGGNPTSPADGKVTLDIPASTNLDGAATLEITPVTLDVGKATQYGSKFGVTDLSQDGYAPGQLSGIQFETNGLVMAKYSNGQTKAAGQVELANFRNPNGLQPTGGNGWTSSYASGDPIVGVPGDGNLGALQSSALEESNVDLTAELVNMITAQRVYQANAQTIKTQDQVLQTLVNLR